MITKIVEVEKQFRKHALGEVSIGIPKYDPIQEDPNIQKGVNIFDYFTQIPSSWPKYLTNCRDIEISGVKTNEVLYLDAYWNDSKN